MSAHVEIPLFPLSTVLFPGGPLQLRIFEPRYLAMVRECARANSAFGVCLILRGREAGVPAQPEAVGTLARISDFYTLPDGLLGIGAEGGQRFRVLRARARTGCCWARSSAGPTNRPSRCRRNSVCSRPSSSD